MILAAIVCCYGVQSDERIEMTSSGQQGDAVMYAGPIVYSDQRPPVLVYPKPTLADITPQDVKNKLNEGKVEYVPFPFQDLPVLIYKSNTTPPVHLVDESSVVEGGQSRSNVDKRTGDLETIASSHRTAKSLSDAISKLNILNISADKIKKAISGTEKPTMVYPHLLYSGQPPIHVYTQPIMNQPIAIAQPVGFGEQMSASDKINHATRIKSPHHIEDINIAAASNNNYDSPSSAPPSTATSTQYSYGSSAPAGGGTSRDRDRSRYGYRVSGGGGGSGGSGSSKPSMNREPVQQETDQYQNYDDYDSGYGSQSQSSDSYNDPYDNNVAPAQSSSSANNDDYRAPAANSPPPQQQSLPPLPPPAVAKYQDKYPEAKYPDNKYQDVKYQDKYPDTKYQDTKYQDYEREPERPVRGRYPTKSSYRYRPRYPSSSFNDYNDWDTSPTSAERGWLSSLFGGYNRWRPQQKYRSPFALGSELSLSNYPALGQLNLDADSFSLMRQPIMPPIQNFRPAPNHWFNPRPLPLPSAFRPTLALPGLGNLYGGVAGFGQHRPQHHQPPPPYLAGSSLMPISVRPFNFLPPMMGSGSNSYPVKVPFMQLGPFMRPPFAGPFGGRPMVGPSDMSFAESLKKYNFSNTTGLGGVGLGKSGGDKMVSAATFQQSSFVSPAAGKPVPSHLQKPPIIVYQGIKAPVHVYKAPVDTISQNAASLTRNNSFDNGYNGNGNQVNQSTSFTIGSYGSLSGTTTAPSPVYVASSTPSLPDQSGTQNWSPGVNK